jgi:hypothetical protein
MNTFLRSLYDVVEFIHDTIFALLRFIIVGCVLSAIFIFVTIVPLLYVTNDTFKYVWILSIMVLGTFAFITHRIYRDSREQVPQEEEVLHESENGLVFVREVGGPLPLSLKESAWSSFWWTLYGYALILGAIFLGTLVNGVL